MLKKLICKVIGHDWKEHPLTGGLKTAAPFCECLRCGERGWLL